MAKIYGDGPPFGEGYSGSVEAGQTRSGCLAARGAQGVLGSVAPHRARRAQQPPAGRTTPATVYKCALVNKGLTACPGFRQFCGQFRRPRKMGQGNQERLDLYAERSAARGKNCPPKRPRAQSGGGCGPCVPHCAACSPKSSGGSQAAGSPSGLLRARLFSVRLGGVVFVHIAFSFGGSIQPRLI